MAKSSPHLSIRIDLAHGRFGPGKAALLHSISETGSISAAARSLGMSYARAWHLAEETNSIFQKKLIVTFSGGNRRGGAQLTDDGRRILEIYNSIIDGAEKAATADLAALAAISK